MDQDPHAPQPTLIYGVGWMAAIFMLVSPTVEEDVVSVVDKVELPTESSENLYRN